MRHLIAIALFFICACSATLSAQWGVNFQEDLTERTCPYDTTVTGLFPTTFEVFQTLDDTYEGIIDSSWCPLFVLFGTFKIVLDMENYDFSRPLFVRLRLSEEFDSSMEPYTDYSINRTRSFSWLNTVSKLHLRYQAVDDLTQDTIYRNFEFDSPTYSNSTCLFSERFPIQRVTEIGETLWLSPRGENPPRIYFIGLGSSQPFFLESQRSKADSILFTEANIGADGVYRASPSDVVNPNSNNDIHYYFAPQFEDRIPGPGDIRYLEANVGSDPDTVVQLQLNFADFNDIALPPYTGLAGAKVAGQDSLRHELTISFDDFYEGPCEMYLSVDRPILQNTFLEFGDGEVAFSEDAACFVLESGSGLSVRNGKNFNYGRNGQGLLAAKQESNITIAPGATFTFYNTLRLLHPISFPEGGMHVYLQEGSTLRFGEMANVERKFAEANVWVYVHGKEENVDFGPLTPEERALFVFVDTPVYLSPLPLVKIHTYPNPAPIGSTLAIQFPRLEPEGGKAYALYSTQGRVVAEGVLSVGSNSNAEVALPAHLVEGVYFLRVIGERRNYSVSVVARPVR